MIKTGLLRWNEKGCNKPYLHKKLIGHDMKVNIEGKQNTVNQLKQQLNQFKAIINQQTEQINQLTKLSQFKGLVKSHSKKEFQFKGQLKTYNKLYLLPDFQLLEVAFKNMIWTYKTINKYIPIKMDVETFLSQIKNATKDLLQKLINKFNGIRFHLKLKLK